MKKNKVIITLSIMIVALLLTACPPSVDAGNGGGSGPAVLEQVKAPTFSPTEGLPTKVTVSTETSGARIFYSTNGNDPVPNNLSGGQSSGYEIDISSLSSPVTIKAIAVKDGMTDSEITSITFTGTTPIPTFSETETVISFERIIFDNELFGVTYYYTTDGSEPNEDSTTGDRVDISGFADTITIKVFARKEGYTDSSIATMTYTQKQLDPPIIYYRNSSTSINDGDAIVFNTGLGLNSSVARYYRFYVDGETPGEFIEYTPSTRVKPASGQNKIDAYVKSTGSKDSIIVTKSFTERTLVTEGIVEGKLLFDIDTYYGDYKMAYVYQGDNYVTQEELLSTVDSINTGSEYEWEIVSESEFEDILDLSNSYISKMGGTAMTGSKYWLDGISLGKNLAFQFGTRYEYSDGVVQTLPSGGGAWLLVVAEIY